MREGGRDRGGEENRRGGGGIVDNRKIIAHTTPLCGASAVPDRWCTPPTAVEFLPVGHVYGNSSRGRMKADR